MTRLPHESRLVIDRPDLPEYELNKACPVTGEVSGLEAHHIWRRSAGYPSWWVELPDGTVVGNRINLSSQAHYRVTVNKARIAMGEDGVFYWVESEEWTPLRWQPPAINTKSLGPMEAAEVEADYFANLGVFQDAVVSAYEDGLYDMHKSQQVEPGHDCPTCKRRVPIPKKKSSPTTRVFSCRVPIDDADTFSEIVDAAAEHAGMKSKPHHVYNTLLVGLTLILQAAKSDLP